MVETKYAFKEMKENMARTISKDLDISTKVSIEMAAFLKGKTTEQAKAILQRVLEQTQAIPYKRFTDGVGHRKGAKIGAGRYPEKASLQFMALIEAAEANAQAKGLSSNLKIIHLVAQKGSNQFRSGRQSRRKFKRTHLEIVVEETEAKKKIATKKEKPKAEVKKEQPKEEVKKEVPKEQPKKESPKEETPKEKPAEEIKK